MRDQGARKLIAALHPVATLQEPFVLAHRGGANIYPENTLVAFRNVAAAGNRNLEMDVQVLSDGSLGVMHDGTVDRTTSDTGNVVDFDAYCFSKLIVDSSTWLAGALDTTAPLFEDVLREFGHSVFFVPESKDTKCADKIAQALVRYGLQNNAVIQSFDVTDLAKAVPYGVKTMLLSNTYDPAQAKAVGFNYIGVSTSASDSYIQSVIAAGLKPVVWTIDYRDDWNAYKQKGCVGCFSNDPIWTSGQGLTPRKTDPFARKSFYHGHLSIGTGGAPGDRGSFYGTNRWGFNDNGVAYVLQGWGSPIANAAGTYTLQTNMTLEFANADNTRWGSVAFGSPIDYFFDTGSARSNGYHVLVRQNGIIVLFKLVNGVATQIGTVTTTAITSGQTITLKIDVTPTSITITRTDVTAPNTFTANDTTFRGGYFFFNHTGAGFSFSNVAITP